MIRHHPGIELLTDYAAGSLAEPVALVIACHAWYCAECRAQIARLEAVGAAMIRDLPPVEISDDALATVMSRLDEPAPAVNSAPAVLDAETAAIVPPPARPYLTRPLPRLRWRWRGPALREAPLALSAPGFRASLFRLLPGMTAPRHTHGGHEYTLVLQGGFTDGLETFDRGDFALVDSTRHHEQVADPEGCLCLVVLDAPVRLTGLLGVLVNPFLRLV